MSATAWIVNGINQGQTEYGQFIQSIGWLRVGLVGVTALGQTVLGYRQSRMDRAELFVLRQEFASDPFRSVG